MRTRADNNGPFKEFEFGQWACDEFWQRRSESDARRKARREKLRREMRHAAKAQLVAVRDLLDSAIETLEKPSTPPRG
jgi:hypothetical protein